MTHPNRKGCEPQDLVSPGCPRPDFPRQDALRILGISIHQLQAWERAGLISMRESYTVQEMGQLRTLRSLRDGDVSAASIRDSIVAMRAVSGMANPLEEATAVRDGRQIVFRHLGAVVDPIKRQFCFDFERTEETDSKREPQSLRRAGFGSQSGKNAARVVQDRFLAAVQAEEAGEKRKAIEIYEEIIAADPKYAAAYINLGTIHFHLRQYTRAEELYRQATVADPEYVLAYFDLGNVLDELERMDESIEAYKQAVALSPRYADAHYNLALAYERKGERRSALRHWQAYVRLDRNGPWSEHARLQIHRLLKAERLAIAFRAERFVARGKVKAALKLVE